MNRDSKRIRIVSIGLFLNNRRLLVAERFDPYLHQAFYRPVGGGVEFGEHSQVALRREVQEELGRVIKNIQFVGVIENIFEFGEKRHEIVFLYTAKFVDSQIYELETINLVEPGKEAIVATWKPIAEFEDGHLKLYPDGLLDTIKLLV